MQPLLQTFHVQGQSVCHEPACLLFGVLALLLGHQLPFHNCLLGFSLGHLRDRRSGWLCAHPAPFSPRLRTCNSELWCEVWPKFVRSLVIVQPTWSKSLLPSCAGVAVLVTCLVQLAGVLGVLSGGRRHPPSCQSTGSVANPEATYPHFSAYVGKLWPNLGRSSAAVFLTQNVWSKFGQSFTKVWHPNA